MMPSTIGYIDDSTSSQSEAERPPHYQSERPKRRSLSDDRRRCQDSPLSMFSSSESGNNDQNHDLASDDSSLSEKENYAKNKQIIYKKASERCRPRRVRRSHSDTSLRRERRTSPMGASAEIETTGTSREDSSSLNDSSLSAQYAAIKGKNRSPIKTQHDLYHFSRQVLSSIKEMPSPIHPYNDDLPEPMERLPNRDRNNAYTNFKPQFTSTMLSLPKMEAIDPLPLPRQGSLERKYIGRSYFTSSTPREAHRRRIPKLCKYSDIVGSEDAYQIDPVPEGIRPRSPSGEREFAPIDFGCPTALARKKNISGILFLSLSLQGSWLKIRIRRAHMFFDPPPFVASFIRSDLTSPSFNRKRHRTPRSSLRTNRVAFSRNPCFNHKFAFEIDREERHARLHISLYTISRDGIHKDFFGGMTFSVGKLLFKAAERNGGHLPGQRDRISIGDGGYYLLADDSARKTNFPRENVHMHTEYSAESIDGPRLSSRQELMGSDDWRSSSATGTSWTQSFEGSSKRLLSQPPLRTFGYSTSSSSQATDFDQLVSYDYTSASSSMSGVSYPRNRAHALQSGSMPSLQQRNRHPRAEEPAEEMPLPHLNLETRRYDMCRKRYDENVPPVQLINSRRHSFDSNDMDQRPSSSQAHMSCGRSSEADSFDVSGVYLGRVRLTPERTLANTQSDTTRDVSSSTQENSSAHRQKTPPTVSKVKKLKTSLSLEAFNPIRRAINHFRNRDERSQHEQANRSCANDGRYHPLGQRSLNTPIPSREELLQYRTNFQHMMRSEGGRNLFRKFLEMELSVENMDFVESVMDYRAAHTAEDRRIIGEAVLKEFIEDNSPNEVNLEYDVRMKILASYSEWPADLFDEAEERILQLMKKDSFFRWLSDDSYLKHV